MASSIVNFGWLFYCAITEYCYALGYSKIKTVQLENNCTATNGKIYTGYAIKQSNSQLVANNMYYIILCVTFCASGRHPVVYN